MELGTVCAQVSLTFVVHSKRINDGLKPSLYITHNANGCTTTMKTLLQGVLTGKVAHWEQPCSNVVGRRLVTCFGVDA